MLEAQRYIGWDHLPSSYSVIFQDAGYSNFFLSYPWFQNFDNTIVSADECVRIYGVEEPNAANKPLAALPVSHMCRNKSLLYPKIMGGLSNYYSSYFAPVLSRDCKDVSAILRVIVHSLWTDRALWDVLCFQPLDNTSIIFSLLLQTLKEMGIITQTYFCFGNWYLDVSGQSYGDYFKSLPKVLKKNIPYMSRKLDRTGRVRFDLITGEEGFEQALSDYEKVYNASWREPEPYPTFIRGLAQLCMKNKSLRLGLIYLDDEPAAAQFWIVHGSVALIYKICYDERFSKLSVGTILTARLMQHVIDIDQVQEVDYLSGDDAYKQNWMSHRRERWGIMAFNPSSLHGNLQAVRHVGGRAAKRTLTSLCRWGRGKR